MKLAAEKFPIVKSPVCTGPCSPKKSSSRATPHTLPPLPYSGSKPVPNPAWSRPHSHTHHCSSVTKNQHPYTTNSTPHQGPHTLVTQNA